MKIKVKGPTDKQINQLVDKFQENIDKQLLVAFQSVALQAVTDARNKAPNESYREAVNSMAHARGVARATIGPETPGFNDQSANLRASIGYIIIKDGKIMSEDFTGGSGSQVGKKAAASVIADHPQGWALIIVAGMQYASYVEALGFDVITGSTLGMISNLTKALKHIKKPTLK